MHPNGVPRVLLVQLTVVLAILRGGPALLLLPILVALSSAEAAESPQGATGDVVNFERVLADTHQAINLINLPTGVRSRPSDQAKTNEAISHIERALTAGSKVSETFLACLDPAMPANFRTLLLRGFQSLKAGLQEKDVSRSVQLQTESHELLGKWDTWWRPRGMAFKAKIDSGQCR